MPTTNRILGLLMTVMPVVSPCCPNPLRADENGKPIELSDPMRWRARHTVQRDVPVPSPKHPGNVFVEGQVVHVPVPKAAWDQADGWRVLNDALVKVRFGGLRRGANRTTPRVAVGRLGIGWYRLEFVDEQDRVVAWTTAAVLARLNVPTPQDSPIGVMSGISLFSDNHLETMAGFSSLATLAGVSWVRDLTLWRDMHLAPDRFSEPTTVWDRAAAVQSAHGLRILGAFHGHVPAWAVSEPSRRGRTPRDPRHTFRFCREMAKRFRGRFQAWEPWNEGNAHNFGGHTIDELCTHQKAAYLGFKATDPNVTVCWAPLGGINTPDLVRGILLNETWPYYDVYSIHAYDWPHAYEELWAPAREAACGRPIWMSECDRGMKADPDSPHRDYAHAFALRKAEFMAQSYACSLAAGVTRHAHFILSNYTEKDGSIQFGLLRHDQTPRLSYVALAAVGRMLAGARCLGRWRVPSEPDAHVVAFRSRPDGVERNVLVAWIERKVDWPERGKAEASWSLPFEPSVLQVYDYLGRPLGQRLPDKLRSSPVFVILPVGQAERLVLESPTLAPWRGGKPSPVVLQLRMPRHATIRRQPAWTQEHDRTAPPGQRTPITLCAYNLSDRSVEGSVRVARLPDGWALEPSQWRVELTAMDCDEVRTTLSLPPGPADPETGLNNWVQLRGDFGASGRAVLAFRVLPRATE